MARSADPVSYATVVTHAYIPGISLGVLRPDDSACARSRTPCRLPNDPVMTSRWTLARATLGLALVHRQILKLVEHRPTRWQRAGGALLNPRPRLKRPDPGPHAAELWGVL